MIWDSCRKIFIFMNNLQEGESLCLLFWLHQSGTWSARGGGDLAFWYTNLYLDYFPYRFCTIWKYVLLLFYNNNCSYLELFFIEIIYLLEDFPRAALTGRTSLIFLLYLIMEALQFHSNTQSHWSSGWNFCFLPRGAAVHVLGMQPHLEWKQVLLLAKSRYIGDLNMIPDHWLHQVLFAWDLATTLATSCLSHAFPCSILHLAGPPPL